MSVTATAGRRCTALSVAEHRDWASLEALRPQYDRLLAQNPQLGIFSTFEWLGAWWRAYEARKELRALSFTDAGGEVVGACLLYEQRGRSAFSPRVLRFIGDGSEDSDDLDFVVAPGREQAVADAFLNWLRTAEWDVCYLDCISPHSSVCALLRAEVARRRWTHTWRSRSFLTVHLPDSWEQYLKRLSGKERGKIGNLTRRLEHEHQVRFFRCETVEQLPARLETLFRLHQQRWEAVGEPGSFSLQERRAFYGEMSRSLLSRGWLELWIVELDGQAAAAQIALRYNDVMYALQEGFDLRFANRSVGYVLRAHVLRHCITAGIRRYEFLAGDQDSKQRWGAEAGTYTDLHFARPGGLGEFHLLRDEYVRDTKDWLRSRLPESAMRALRALRSRGGRVRRNGAASDAQGG